jgi:hypothetical protein
MATGKMTRSQHFAEAERLITSTRPWADDMFSAERKRQGRTPGGMAVEIDYALRLAQIHATLAASSLMDSARH